MNRQFEAEYQPLNSPSEHEDEEVDFGDIEHQHSVEILPGKNKARWAHIPNLDDFFKRVYEYLKRSGFVCMVVQDAFQLIVVLIVVAAGSFVFNCIDFSMLSGHAVNGTFEQHWKAAFLGDQCHENYGWFEILVLVFFALVWICRLILFVINLPKYWEMRSFYMDLLNIDQTKLMSMTWHEVLKGLLNAQKQVQMCVRKSELTQLDVYNRILRFTNYMVALVNKDVLPIKFELPYFGEVTFLTKGLIYNYEFLLFRGYGAPFSSSWSLDAEYKHLDNRKLLAKKLRQRILLVGILNLVFTPVIFVLQLIFTVFRYTDLVRREPGELGARRWSLFGRFYLRHFNELDHELRARLNRGYNFAKSYINSFSNPVLTVIAKNLAFMFGAAVAILLVMSLWDNVSLFSNDIFQLLAIFTIGCTICRSLIPDENQVFVPERLLRHTLAQIHYMPDNWKGNAHKLHVSKEFSQLFQLKIVFLLEEILSPIVTPFILIFWLRPRALSIVDFLRNHTVEVDGVGDVCAFAQLDVGKRGSPRWVPENATEAAPEQQAQGGKVELSLLHFTKLNPEFKPKRESRAFLNGMTQQAQRDQQQLGLSMPTLDNPLASSMHSIAGFGQTSILPSLPLPYAMPPPASNATQPQSVKLTGAISAMEGPVTACGTSSVLSSMMHSRQLQSITHDSMLGSLQGPMSLHSSAVLAEAAAISSQAVAGQSAMQRSLTEGALELMSNDMNYSALFLHALHDRRMTNILEPYFDEDLHAAPDANEQPLFQSLGADTAIGEPLHVATDFGSGSGSHRERTVGGLMTSVLPMEEIPEDGDEVVYRSAVEGAVASTTSSVGEKRPLLRKDANVKETR